MCNGTLCIHLYFGHSSSFGQWLKKRWRKETFSAIFCYIYVLLFCVKVVFKIVIFFLYLFLSAINGRSVHLLIIDLTWSLLRNLNVFYIQRKYFYGFHTWNNIFSQWFLDIIEINRSILWKCMIKIYKWTFTILKHIVYETR